MPDYTSTDRLYQLCRERLTVLEQLRVLALQQLDVVHSIDTDGLLSMLAQKQSLLDAVQRIQSELLPYQSQDPEQRTWSSPQKRLECRELADQGQRILQDLLSMEASSIETLRAQRDTVASELELTHQAQEVRSAYDCHELFETSSFSNDTPLSLEG